MGMEGVLSITNDSKHTHAISWGVVRSNILYLHFKLSVSNDLFN